MTTYNSKAPSHYNQYWTLEDNEPKLKEMASDILRNYIQSWGQTNQKRLEVLMNVANKVGFHIEIVGESFKVKSKEVEKFTAFKEEIRNIRRGNFESEIVQIASIIRRYTPKKWYRQLYKFLKSL